jgi:ATP-binding cassette subfamily B protein
MIKHFFSYYRPYKGLFLLDFMSAVLLGALELIFPLTVNQFVDKLLPTHNWSLITWACILLFIVFLFNSFLQFVVTYWGHKLGINIETDIRKKLFDHIQKLSFRYFDNNKTGHLTSRLSNDLMDIGEVAHHGPEDIFVALMTIIGTFAAMCWINIELALLTFITIPILLILIVWFNQKMTKTFRKLWSDIADFYAQVENNISGIRVVQAFANEEYEKKAFAVKNNRFRKTKLNSYKIAAYSSSISTILSRLITIFVLVFGTWFVIEDKISYGGFVGFVLLVNVLFKPIEKLNAVVELYPKGIAGFKRYLELLHTEPEITNSPNAVNIDTLKGDIRYENVDFSYEPNEPILQNINLTIKPGETVAFVGPSGAGKTTLCSLLPRFYDVTGGRITIDGIDIRNITLSSLRNQIGIVQQDVFLFSGTLRENINYGNLQATEEDIWKAAKYAQLDEFIRSQPQGLDTIIGERGVKLSGGQKQRVAIARMFLKNPPILILDEATSALDTQTENAIQASLTELSKGRTTLIIAHRLATIKNADRIVVVSRDGIVEQGKHEELIASGGVYSKLHQAQFA